MKKYNQESWSKTVEIEENAIKFWTMKGITN